MDKLEEIKALRNNAGFYANITVHDKATEQVDWLVGEIELLKKEKEWLLEQYCYYRLTDVKGSLQEPKEIIVQEMKQELKEE